MPPHIGALSSGLWWDGAGGGDRGLSAAVESGEEEGPGDARNRGLGAANGEVLGQPGGWVGGGVQGACAGASRLPGRLLGRLGRVELLAVALAAFLAPCEGFGGLSLATPPGRGLGGWAGANRAIPCAGAGPAARHLTGLGLAMGPTPGQGEEKKVRGRAAVPSKGRGKAVAQSKKRGTGAVLEGGPGDDVHIGGWGPLVAGEGAHESLTAHVGDETWKLWMTLGFPAMLNSLETALHDSRASARKAAVGQVLKYAAEHPEGPAETWVIQALSGRLEDDSACVREAAVRGLVKVSEKGNRPVVVAMASLIDQDSAVTVKKAALQALPRLANRGDEEALAPVMKVLERVQMHERCDIFDPHASRMLSKQAVRALGNLAGRGNEAVLKVLIVRVLDEREPSVREAAARSISNLADVDDAKSIAALRLCMEDEDEGVKRAAVRGVRAMLRRQKLDQDLLEGVEGVLEEEAANRLWLLPGVWGG